MDSTQEKRTSGGPTPVTDGNPNPAAQASLGAPSEPFGTVRSVDEHNYESQQSTLRVKDMPPISHPTQLIKRRFDHSKDNGDPSPGDLEKQTPRVGEKDIRDTTHKNAPGLSSHRVHHFWNRLRGRHLDHVPTLWESIRATLTHSWVNALFVFVPISWVSHFLHWDARIVFTLSFIALIPLENVLQFGGAQMMFYLGAHVGDLVVITLANIVEAILAIILLLKCEIKLVQSTVIGVVLLQLLFVPGILFISGGSKVIEQDLHPTITQLNQTLMTMGVLATIIPAVMYAASYHVGVTSIDEVVTDELRHNFLAFSRGIAIILLFVYVASRVYLLNPPGDDNALEMDDDVPDAVKAHEEHLRNGQPDIHPMYGFALLAVAVTLVAVTAEWLVHSINFVHESVTLSHEWFGLILLPLISFSGDGIITFSYLIRRALFHTGAPPELADARPIDLAIQFSLFWIPLLVILAWILDKPLSMLFDLFEVTMLVGACFLVNYITADAKTNWAEGYTMVSFYAIIALVAWFYTGQEAIEAFIRPYCEVYLAGSSGGESSNSESSGHH